MIAVIAFGVLSLPWATAQLGWVAGPSLVKICGAIQYLNLFGVSIGYTIASSISLMAIKKSNCFRSEGDNSSCRISANPYMIGFDALGFWPPAIYFPVKMYIVQKTIPKWSAKCLGLQIPSVACLVFSIATAAGSIAGIVYDLEVHKPIKNIS
ncbi:Hypothetical predicted protein [Olea europaea subsp. europaea]|uniref:Amino acid transporter transmembrane domain-containing protein n=1 Tax=Olea europaea subsp. europaea TaxID=158383 RepID=A0A8S0R5B5_OLEEU|nr:Hypothetical predicted protein [Olea europaea subsp. europaea]